MKLYILRNSPNCRKVLATINALNLTVEQVHFDLSKHETRTPAFLAINPNGKTPTLDDNGFLLWESNAIMQYLADKTSSSTLFSADSKCRADIIRWQFWETNHYGRAIGDILWERFAKELFTGNTTDPQALEDALNRFHQLAPILNQQLEHHRFVTGDTATLADFSLACHAGFIEMGNLPITDYPAIANWYQRMNEVPGWVESAPIFE